MFYFLCGECTTKSSSNRPSVQLMTAVRFRSNVWTIRQSFFRGSGLGVGVVLRHASWRPTSRNREDVCFPSKIKRMTWLLLRVCLLCFQQALLLLYGYWLYTVSVPTKNESKTKKFPFDVAPVKGSGYVDRSMDLYRRNAEKTTREGILQKSNK
jgi:hypothetical protein